MTTAQVTLLMLWETAAVTIGNTTITGIHNPQLPLGIRTQNREETNQGPGMLLLRDQTHTQKLKKPSDNCEYQG
jgi:hypothetical protein